MRKPLAIALCSPILATVALAVPGEVANVRFESKTDLAWDAVAGAAGYHVYQGDVADLPDDSTCLIGSQPSESVAIDSMPAAGQALYLLVAAFDEDGQGTVGVGRATADTCAPARRIFPAVRDGDAGDGVIDGDHPLRNPSVWAIRTKRDTVGVFLHTGEFFLTASNLEIPGRHLGFALRRTYRSQVSYDGPLGHNWDFDLNARLVPLGSDVRHHDGSGRQENFGRIDATHFTSPRGRYAVLIENADGSFTLRGPHGLLRNFHAFDGSNVQGVLESIEDRFGDRISLAYDHQGLLTAITGSLGRAIDFAYNADGRMTTMTDFAGRSWVYGYDANGDLVSARSPVVTGTPNGNDFPGGKTTGYTYSSGFADDRLNHCLLTVVNPNEEASGVPWIQNSYLDSTAPALEVGKLDQTIAGGTNSSGIPAGGTIDFGYEFLNSGAPPDETTPRRRTTVVDANGNQRRYVHNFHGERIEETWFTNREVRPGEPDYTASYAYNADGELVQATLPEGNQIQYTYDTPGADRYREGNTLEMRRVADPLSGGGRGDGHGGESADLVTTYTYDQAYNLRLSRTGPRGNDSGYVPQNGGTQSADRYTTDWTYCHQEGDPATNGLDEYAGRFGIDLTGFPGNLGDVNGDGDTSRIFGTPIRVVLPEVALDPSSNQAGIEGDTSQDTVYLHRYNPFAQRTRTTDPEGNVHEYAYHPENDPDGDGTPTPAPPDGRALDTLDGGYLASRRLDTTPGPSRNNGTDPAPADVEITYDYDEVGNVTHRVGGRGVLTRFVRNALNQVVELRRAAATSDASGPDGDPPTGRGESGLTAFGFRVRYEYDANDNVTAIRREDRNQGHGVGSERDESFVWDISDRKVARDVEVSAGTPLRTDYRYDANFNLNEIVRPEGNSDQIRYDERDLAHQTEKGAAGPRGGTPIVRTFDYDGNGNRTRLIDGRGNPIDTEYDGHDRKVRRIDQLGNTIEFFHDPASNVVRVLHRGPVGGPPPADRSGGTNVDLSDVEYLWDEQSRSFRVDRGLFVPSGAAPGRSPVIDEGPLVSGDGAVNTIYERDRLGRLTFVVRDTGAKTRTDYDGAGRVVRTTTPDGSTVELTWDDQHNMIESAETELSSSAGPPSELFLTTHFFDALDRLEKTVDNAGLTTQRIYSSLDALIKTSDGNGPAGPAIDRRSAAGAGLSVTTNNHGNVTDYSRDGLGRLLRVDRILTASGLGDGTPSPPPTTTDPNNPDGLISTHYAWDDNSLPASIQDDALHTTSYSHDNLDRLLSHTNDDGTQESYVYDQESNVTQRTDPVGNVMTQTWDAANRMTQISVARASGVEGTTLQTFEHDGLHRRTLATDDNDPLDAGDDAEVECIYDSLDRAVEEKQRYGTLPTGQKLVDLRWTADRLLDELVYPSGRQVRYAYDPSDRLQGVSDTARAETASFDWFGMARLHTRSYGNGVRMTMLNDAGTLDEGYDDVRRITRMRHLDGADNVLAGFEHSYDRASNRGHELRLHDEDAAAGGFRGELWAFDSGNRLIDFEEGLLDAALNLVGPPADAQSWALDGDGNWVQMTRNGTTYNFTPNNLHAYDEPQSGGAASDDGLPDDAYDDDATPAADGENRAHDENGNRTEDASLQYAFDFANRLVRVSETASGAPIAEYRYDAFDRRVFREVTNSGDLNETRRYLYTPVDPGAYVALPGGTLGNCADDAVDSCNSKHPDPQSDQEWDLYDLCIKAQLGQKCPSSTGAMGGAMMEWVTDEAG